MNSNGPKTSPRWCSRNPDDCLWARFGDDYVLYHRPSGKTHLFNEASHRLLTATLKEPRSIDSITGEFVGVGEEADRAQARPHWIELLRRLEQLGLVERV